MTSDWLVRRRKKNLFGKCKKLYRKIGEMNFARKQNRTGSDRWN